jgi:hypothetical protein
MKTYRATIYFEDSQKTIFEDVEVLEICGKAEAQYEVFHLLHACHTERWKIIDISPIEEFETDPNE